MDLEVVICPLDEVNTKQQHCLHYALITFKTYGHVWREAIGLAGKEGWGGVPRVRSTTTRAATPTEKENRTT